MLISSCAVVRWMVTECVGKLKPPASEGCVENEDPKTKTEDLRPTGLKRRPCGLKRRPTGLKPLFLRGKTLLYAKLLSFL